jgi:uncharacterized protein YecE (DUF72 family)
MKGKKNLFIGTSGWSYEHWGKGVFYPKGLSQSNRLKFYSEQFTTVEINSTFYNNPKSHVLTHWESTVGKNFKFSVKVNKFITHIVKLKNPEEHLAKFYEPCAVLEDKLGPMLLQFDKYFIINADSLRNVLEYTKKQYYIRAPKLVFEFRNKKCMTDEIFDILREYNAALCFTDYMRDNITSPETADFIYLRRHGPGSKYGSLYTKEQLEEDAKRIKKWRKENKEVYVYFNNDANGWAAQNAKELYSMI